MKSIAKSVLCVVKPVQHSVDEGPSSKSPVCSAAHRHARDKLNHSVDAEALGYTAGALLIS
jgi:hypothetical protein